MADMEDGHHIYVTGVTYATFLIWIKLNRREQTGQLKTTHIHHSFYSADSARLTLEAYAQQSGILHLDMQQTHIVI